MYQTPNVNRRRNPRDGANYLSLFTFAFATDIFRRRLLDEDDIYRITEAESSVALGDRAEALWRKHESLSKVVLRLLGRRYLLYGCLYLGGNIGAMITMPSAMEGLISYFNPQSELTTLEGCLYGLSVLVMLVTLGCALVLYQYALEVMGVRVRVALCSLMYRKSLRLSEQAVLKLGNGRIVTMMTKDLNIFETVLQYAHEAWIGFGMLSAMLVMLYVHMDATALLGGGLLVALLPLQVWAALLIKRLRLKAAGRTDRRLRRVQEMLDAIKLVKLYNWEAYFRTVIGKLRSQELSAIDRIYSLRAIISGLSVFTWRLALFLSILFYSWGNYLSPEKAYLATTCYALIRNFYDKNLCEAMLQLPEARSSLARIEDFLRRPEADNPVSSLGTSKLVCVTGPTIEGFLQRPEAAPSVNPVPRLGTSKLVCIVGPTASGKSHFLKNVFKSMGEPSYASQEPWVFPATVRQNILFGQPYNPKRYNEVLHVCALTYDLKGLPKGDMTVLTGGGLNLSRGQQCRVNLARAVYKDADVYLLDDIFSSLDTKVANFLFEECILRYLAGKLRIVVCQNGRFLERSDEVVHFTDAPSALESADNGHNFAVGAAVNEINSGAPPIRIDKLVPSEDRHGNSDIPKSGTTAADVPSPSTLPTYIKEETAFEGAIEGPKEERPYFEVAKKGAVGLGVYGQYLAYAGGWLVGVVVVLALINEYLAITYDYNLTIWLEAEQILASAKTNASSDPGNATLANIYDQSTKSRNQTVLVYSAFMCQSFWHILWYYMGYKLALRASLRIHGAVFDKVASATMTFFDGQHSGNVLNRFAKDFAVVDDRLPLALMSSLDCFFLFAFILAVIGEIWPLFLVPSAAMIGALVVFSRVYLRTSRDLRRLEAATRAPIVGFVVSTLEGLPTIRAAGNEGVLRRQFDEHQDLNTSAMLMYVAAKRSFVYWTNVLQSCFAGAVIFAFVFYHRDMFAGDVGFVLQQALSLDVIVSALQIWTDVENCMVSTERVFEYLDAEQEFMENPETPERKGSTRGPERKFAEREVTVYLREHEQGGICFKDVSLRYPSCDGFQLTNVDFRVAPGENIGVVGRTGSGKSTLVSALFRLYNYEGAIHVGGDDISRLPLHYLRSNISIVPQAPLLLEGTIRDNLDPLHKFTDGDLLDALGKVGLGFADLNHDAGSLGLSAGQVQQLCLARCILRKNRVLVLDEATAYVDVETEKAILKTVRGLFSGATVVTIAHKLEVVMDSDRVVVLDAGRVVEVGSPEVLLQKTHGAFQELAKNCGLVE